MINQKKPELSSKLIEIFTQQTIRAENGYLNAQQTGSYQLLALCSRQFFKSQLALGLIKWRNNEDPRPNFEKAIERAVTNIPELSKLSTLAVIEEDFRLENLKIIAFLLDKTTELEINLESVKETDRRLDCLLASTICDRVNLKIDTQTHIEILKLFKNKRTSLAAKTYETYFEILHNPNAKNVEEVVKKAENLYLDRSSDSFYSGGDTTDGGGPDNDIVVDFRLAAVLKKINYQGNSIHRWNW